MTVSGKAQRLFMQLNYDAYINVRNEDWGEDRKPEGFVFLNPSCLPTEFAELEQAGVVRRLTEGEAVRLGEDCPPTENDNQLTLEEEIEIQEVFAEWNERGDSTQEWISGGLQRLGNAFEEMVDAIPEGLMASGRARAVVYHVMELKDAYTTLTGKPWFLEGL